MTGGPAAAQLPGNHQITRAWRSLRRGGAIKAYQDILFEGLDHAQIDALDALEGGELRMSQLAVALRVERSTATRAVERLEAQGLAERRTVRGEGTGRAVIVSLTERGRRVHRTVAARRQELVDRILRDFSRAEVAQLAGLLQRLLAGYERVIDEAQRSVDHG